MSMRNQNVIDIFKLVSRDECCWIVGEEGIDQKSVVVVLDHPAAMAKPSQFRHMLIVFVG